MTKVFVWTIFALILKVAFGFCPTTDCKLNKYNQYSCFLEKETVHYIDFWERPDGQNNFLFRGNMPKNTSEQFAYDELASYLRAEAKKNDVIFSSPFYLIDLSLLVFVENDDLEIEKKFFANNPEKGMVTNYPLMGMCEMSPQIIPDAYAFPMALDLDNWTWDDLISKATMLRTLLTQAKTPYDLPVVIYIHCEAGKDRTGELSATYYLKYKKWSWNQTVAFNSASPPVRLQAPDNLNAMQWFCTYLRAIGYSLNCSLQAPPELVPTLEF